MSRDNELDRWKSAHYLERFGQCGRWTLQVFAAGFEGLQAFETTRAASRAASAHLPAAPRQTAAEADCLAGALALMDSGGKGKWISFVACRPGHGHLAASQLCQASLTSSKPG